MRWRKPPMTLRALESAWPNRVAQRIPADLRFCGVNFSWMQPADALSPFGLNFFPRGVAAKWRAAKDFSARPIADQGVAAHRTQTRHGRDWVAPRGSSSVRPVSPADAPGAPGAPGATQSCNARLGAVWNRRTIRQHTRPKSGEPIQTPMAANDFTKHPRPTPAPSSVVHCVLLGRNPPLVRPGAVPPEFHGTLALGRKVP